MNKSIIEDLIKLNWKFSAGILVLGNAMILYIIPNFFLNTEKLKDGHFKSLLTGGYIQASKSLAILFSIVMIFSLVMSLITKKLKK